MATFEYINFDLLIESAGEAYRVRVLESPAGEAQLDFTAPFSDLELENFYLRMGRPRRGIRRIDSPEMEAARQYGSRLFETIFNDDVYACYRSSLDSAQKEGKGLHLRLRVSAPELADLPWEYLYNSRLDQFISLAVETPIVRYLEVSQPMPAQAVSLPLNVLVLISSPSDYPTLDADGEWQRLTTALEPLIQRGLLNLTRCDDASMAALQRQLRRGDYHIFHFIGHGHFDPQTQDGLLLFEDEEGKGRPLSGDYLGTLLHNHPSLRLAVLNACEGARTSRSDPFAGVAHSLVQKGLPAVVAMQFEITDDAAVTFASEFYTALADGYPISAALAEARVAIFAQENDIEWGTPVLFTQSPDGRIFNLVPGAAAHETRDAALPTLPPAPRSAKVEQAAPPAQPAAAGSPPIYIQMPAPADTKPSVQARVIGFIIFIVAAIVMWSIFSSNTRGTRTTYGPAYTVTPTRSEAYPTYTPYPTALPTPVVIKDSFGISMAVIPAGTFQMGSEGGNPDEAPVHTVYLDTFYIDIYEVSNGDYAKCSAVGVCQEPASYDSNTNTGYFHENLGYPVIHVSWEDAQAYCNFRGGRLPTEAEWEKAARGWLVGMDYPWGNDEPSCNLIPSGANLSTCTRKDVTPLGSFRSNGYGLFDMAGNVWEWTADWYDDDYYSTYASNNPTGPAEGTRRVVRGGCWYDGVDYLRVAFRGSEKPTETSDQIGFRCVTTP